MLTGFIYGVIVGATMGFILGSLLEEQPMTRKEMARMAQYVVNQANPLIRYPFEVASQTVMRTGAPVADAYGELPKKIGPTAYHALQHTPASRLMSVVNKGMGIPSGKNSPWQVAAQSLTPLQTVDVNIDTSIRREIEKLGETAFRNSPNIGVGSYPYVKGDNLLTPQEQTFMDISKAHQRDKTRRAALGR